MPQNTEHFPMRFTFRRDPNTPGRVRSLVMSAQYSKRWNHARSTSAPSIIGGTVALMGMVRWFPTDEANN